jgi:ferredoxin/flavodoxin---NADP+ reductase
MGVYSKEHQVLDIINLTESIYILRFERNGLSFIPGQNITLSLIDENDSRPYSIFSGIQSDYLEVLIKEVENGNLSKKFRKLAIGTPLLVSAPYGGFTIEQLHQGAEHFYFIATGTGISPFHSIINSYNNLNFTLIHGIRFEQEQFKEYINSEKYVSCITQGFNGNFNGRVTSYIKQSEIQTGSYFFICGSYDMIDDVYAVLENKGVLRNNIVTEGYF